VRREVLVMKKIKKEIAKLVSSSGDLWGASWMGS